MRTVVVASLALSVFVGCGGKPIYEISTMADSHGILYYSQQQYDVKTLTYDQTFYELKVTATFAPAASDNNATTDKKKLDKDKPAQQKKKSDDGTEIVRTVIAYARDFSTAEDYYKTFAAKPDNVGAWAASGKRLLAEAKNPASDTDILSVTPFERVAKLADLADPTASVKGIRLTSASTSRVQIPSTTPSYFQVTAPYGGSANGEIDLNTDGTIGKGLAQKQDQLPGAVVGALGALGGTLLTGPLTTVTGHFLAPATAPAAQAADGLNVLNVSFTITPIHRLYTMTLTKPASAQSAVCGRDKWDALVEGFEPDPPCRLNLTIAMKRDDGPDDKTKDNNISITGSVALPAPAATPGAAK